MISSHLKAVFWLCLIVSLSFSVLADGPSNQLDDLHDGQTIEAVSPVQKDSAAVVPTSLPTLPAWAVSLPQDQSLAEMDAADGAAQAWGGDLCLDCDTNADCIRLCGARGFELGLCLRDLGRACSIDIDDKVCACI